MAILATGMVAFAQERKSRPAEKERIEQRMTKLTADLNLNEKQQVELKQLLEEQVAKRETKMAEMEKRREAGTKPSSAEKEEMKKEREAAQKNFQTKLRSILTNEQMKKWNALNEERKETLKSKQKEQ